MIYLLTLVISFHPFIYFITVRATLIHFALNRGKYRIKVPHDFYRICIPSLPSSLIYTLSSHFMLDLPIAHLFSTLFPEHEWHFWVFLKEKDGWCRRENQKMFLSWLYSRLNLSHPREWYDVNPNTVVYHGGKELLKMYGTLSLALFTLFPQHQFQLWLFQHERVPPGFWEYESNQRQFFYWYARDRELKAPSDLYRIRGWELKNLKCNCFLKGMYGGSGIRAISSLFPEFRWNSLLFRHVRQYSKRKEEELYERMCSHLNLKSPKEWERVSMVSVREIAGRYVIPTASNLFKLLKKVVPDHKWDLCCFLSQQKKSSQRMVEKLLERYLPKNTVVANNKMVHGCGEMEIDIFVDEVALGLEYQGAQHYEEVYCVGKLDSMMERDERKEKSCNEMGITLIQLPFWDLRVDGRMKKCDPIQTVKSLLSSNRPDLTVN